MTNRPFASTRWAVTASILGALVACTTDAPLDTSEGSVAVTASALSASDVAKVTITITAPDIASPIVASLVKVGGSWQGIVGKIPAGTGRHFHGEAYTAANTVVYSVGSPGTELEFAL